MFIRMACHTKTLCSTYATYGLRHTYFLAMVVGGGAALESGKVIFQVITKLYVQQPAAKNVKLNSLFVHNSI